MSRYFTVTFVPPIGATIGNAYAEFFEANTTTQVAVYSDSACTQEITQPIAIPSDPATLECYFVNTTANYDMRIGGGNLSRQATLQNIWALPGTIWDLNPNLWSNDPAVWDAINPVPVTVATAQNVGQFYTANDIIRASMRLIQVSAVDTDLTANELQDGLESLNRMLDSWSADELTLYQVIRETFNLATGQNPYTMGYGGDFNTSRPMKIVDAYLTLNNGSIPVSYPMQVLGYDDYNAIRLKTLQTNFPNYIYWQPSFPLSEVYIYPVFAPNDPSTQGPATITLTSWKPFNIILDPTANMEYPPGYWEAIVFNLAVRIAEEYQFEMRQTTVQIAANSLKRLKRMNQRTPTLQTDVALMNTSQLRYNIYSDGFGR